MEEPDDFDRAIECVKWSIGYLRRHEVLFDPEDPEALACRMALNDLERIWHFLSPPDERWPTNVVRFPIERRG
jgi:hypothetical protein